MCIDTKRKGRQIMRLFKDRNQKIQKHSIEWTRKLINRGDRCLLQVSACEHKGIGVLYRFGFYEHKGIGVSYWLVLVNFRRLVSPIRWCLRTFVI